MSKLAFDYNIRSDLPPNPESPAALGARFVSTLDTLSSIDPSAFRDWRVMTYPVAAAVPLEAARPRIASIIERAFYRSSRQQVGCVAGLRCRRSPQPTAKRCGFALLAERESA